MKKKKDKNPLVVFLLQFYLLGNKNQIAFTLDSIEVYKVLSIHLCTGLDIFLFICSHYYVTMNIGNPAKPYFLDVDTGSDLTWLQCDAPCRSCNKVPLSQCCICILQGCGYTVFGSNPCDHRIHDRINSIPVYQKNMLSVSGSKSFFFISSMLQV